jgi:hypothetical protein
MKTTIFSKLMLGALVVAAGFALSACSNDDEPKVEDKFTTEYTFEVEFSADLIATADVKAYILSPEGVVSEETITKAKNTWTLKGNSIPDKAGVRFEFDAKSGSFSGDYEAGYKVCTTVTCYKNDGIESTKTEKSDESYTVPAENLTEFYGTQLTLGGAVNAQGAASVTDGSNLDGGVGRPPMGGVWGVGDGN